MLKALEGGGIATTAFAPALRLSLLQLVCIELTTRGARVSHCHALCHACHLCPVSKHLEHGYKLAKQARPGKVAGENGGHAIENTMQKNDKTQSHDTMSHL